MKSDLKSLTSCTSVHSAQVCEGRMNLLNMGAAMMATQHVIIHLFIYLLKANSPVNRTGSPQGFNPTRDLQPVCIQQQVFR